MVIKSGSEMKRKEMKLSKINKSICDNAKINS